MVLIYGLIGMFFVSIITECILSFKEIRQVIVSQFVNRTQDNGSFDKKPKKADTIKIIEINLRNFYKQPCMIKKAVTRQNKTFEKLSLQKGHTVKIRENKADNNKKTGL